MPSELGVPCIGNFHVHHIKIQSAAIDREYCKHKNIVKPCIQYTCILVQAKVVLVCTWMWKWNNETDVCNFYCRCAFFLTTFSFFNWKMGGVPKMVGFPPKSSILIGFSIINHPFWDTTPYFWKHPNPLFTNLVLHFALPRQKWWGGWSSSTVKLSNLEKWCLMRCLCCENNLRKQYGCFRK